MWGWPWVDRRIRVGRMRREGGREGATADLEMAVQFVCRWPFQEQDRPWAGISDITASSLECCSFQLFPHSHLHFLYQSHVSISIGSNIFYIIRRKKKNNPVEPQGFVPRARHSTLLSQLYFSQAGMMEWRQPPTPPPPPHTHAPLLGYCTPHWLFYWVPWHYRSIPKDTYKCQRLREKAQYVCLFVLVTHDFFEPACDIGCDAASLLHSALQYAYFSFMCTPTLTGLNGVCGKWQANSIR